MCMCVCGEGRRDGKLCVAEGVFVSECSTRRWVHAYMQHATFKMPPGCFFAKDNSHFSIANEAWYMY